MKHAITLFLFLSTLLASTQGQALVVLQYHHISENTPAITSVSPDTFRRHMALIERLGLEVVDLETTVRGLKTEQAKTLSASLSPAYDNRVAITFDDAYLSVYQHAAPELKARHWPYTVFVDTEAIDQGHGLNMNWQQLRQIIKQGATLGNHSTSHAHLTHKPSGMSLDAWLNQEVAQAEARIEAMTGQAKRLFAYPYGEFSPAIIDWLKHNHYLAFGQQSGAIGPHSHRQALPRFPASGIYSSEPSLTTKLRSQAFDIAASQLQDPDISDNNPPRLRFTLSSTIKHVQRLSCFASGQGQIPVQISTTSDGQHSVMTQAPKALSGPRARYNCTFPSDQKNRFFWYSQPWQLP